MCDYEGVGGFVQMDCHDAPMYSLNNMMFDSGTPLRPEHQMSMIQVGSGMTSLHNLENRARTFAQKLERDFDQLRHRAQHQAVDFGQSLKLLGVLAPQFRPHLRNRNYLILAVLLLVAFLALRNCRR